MTRHMMFARVILASAPTNGAPPIYTVHCHYPRVIHSEVMTHRVFSRNARSSRAVPVSTMLDEVINDPFVPWHWGKNQKGMQAQEEHNAPVRLPVAQTINGPLVSREEAWLAARDRAVEMARAFMEAGYHKQLVNRILEPYSWIHTLITSTDWANFFHLREHRDAEPHFYDLAVMIREAIEAATPQSLNPGDWHLPFVEQSDADFAREATGGDSEETRKTLIKLSVARCARISYKPFDGDGSIEKEMERYEKLVGSSPLHASPAEHQATPDEEVTYPGGLVKAGYRNPELGGNLGEGWIQYRKTLPGEHYRVGA